MEEERFIMAETMYTPATFCGLVPSFYFIGCLWNACDDDDVKLKHDRHPTSTSLTRITATTNVITIDAA